MKRLLTLIVAVLTLGTFQALAIDEEVAMHVFCQNCQINGITYGNDLYGSGTDSTRDSKERSWIKIVKLGTSVTLNIEKSNGSFINRKFRPTDCGAITWLLPGDVVDTCTPGPAGTCRGSGHSTTWRDIGDGALVTLWTQTLCAAGAGTPGPTGPTGPPGDDGAQGTQGKQGDSGADAPCVDCVVLQPAVVDFACKILDANPPTSQQAFDDCVDAIVDAITLTTNVCGDKAQCIADIKAAIDALK